MPINGNGAANGWTNSADHRSRESPSTPRQSTRAASRFAWINGQNSSRLILAGTFVALPIARAIFLVRAFRIVVTTSTRCLIRESAQFLGQLPRCLVELLLVAGRQFQKVVPVGIPLAQ